MVKKSLINKNVIKALTIALSIAIANHPIVAMAAEDLSTDSDNNSTEFSEEQEEEDITDAAEEVANDAFDEINSAEDAADEVIAMTTDVPSETVKQAAEDLETEIKEDAPTADVEDAIDAINDAEDFNAVAESKAEDAEEQADITEEKAGEAEDLVSEAQELISNAEDAISDANDAIDQSAEEIENAKDVETAETSYTNAETAVNIATEVVENAETRIGEIKEAFDEVKEDYDDAVDAYNDLTGQFNTAEDSFDTNKDVALEEAGNSEASLEEIAAKAEALQAAALQAKEEVEDSDLSHLKDLEDSIQERLDNKQKVNFTGNGSFAEYCDAVVKDYVVSEIFGGEFVSAEWHRFSGDYTYENNNVKSTQGDVLNYCIVTYKDAEGEEHQKYINYKISNSNKTNDANWPGIVIFEKTEHDVLDHHDLTEEDVASLEDGEIIEKGDNSYIKEDDSYYKLAEGVEEVLVEEDDNTVIGDNENVEYAFENNQLIKTVTNDVTVTTFTGATLDAKEATLSTEKDAEDAYKAALQAKINDLKDDESIVIGETEFTNTSTADLTGYTKTETTTYSATGTFSEKFTDKVNKYTDKYEFTNGTYLLGIGQNHETDEITHYQEGNKTVIEYAKVTKVNNSSYSWLYDAIIAWGSDKATLEQKLTDKFAAEGKIFVGIDPTNWSIGTADVFIIDAKELSTEATAETEEAALEAFEAAATEQLSEGAQLYNVNALAEATTKYGYNALNYYIKNVTLKENEIISTTTYDATKVNRTTEYRNDNWYTGDIILLTQDKEVGMDYKTDGKQAYNKNDMISDEAETLTTKNFRDALQAAEDLAQQYQDIADKAKEVQDKFLDAKDKITDLKTELEKVNTTASIDKDVVTFNADLEGELNQAIKDLEKIKQDKNDLADRLEELKDQLDEKIDELTPSSDPVETSDEEEKQEEEVKEEVKSDEDETPAEEDEQPTEEEKQDDEEKSEETEEQEEKVEDAGDAESEEATDLDEEKENAEEVKEEEEAENAEDESNTDESKEEEVDNKEEAPVQEVEAPESSETTTPVVENNDNNNNNAVDENAGTSSEIPQDTPVQNTPAASTTQNNINNTTENNNTTESQETETTEVEDEEVSKTDAPVDTAAEEEVAEEVKDNQEIEEAEIDDDGVAKAAGIAEIKEQKSFNWLWLLLLILAVSVTCSEAYRRHLKKKEKEKEDNK